MNKRILSLLGPIFLVCILPAVLLIGTSSRKTKDQCEINFTSEETKQPDQTVSQQAKGGEDISNVSVLLPSEEVIQMPLEDYILCVVLAEMPSWFESEALKAQAVVARTYTLRRNNGNAKHTAAQVCTDPSCCQGYCDKELFLANGGSMDEYNKIRQAVIDTAGKVIVYNGALIEATYFSCSGGTTEDAAAVWGADVPYLRSTNSPGEEKAAHHTDSVYFSESEFERILGRDIAGDVSDWIGEITYTKGTGVATIDIGGQTYKGKELRSLLGLRSTAFTVSTIGDTLLFTTRGYGHRVGMSQYGADAMAATGSTYEQILQHYYQGTELTNYNA